MMVMSVSGARKRALTIFFVSPLFAGHEFVSPRRRCLIARIGTPGVRSNAGFFQQAPESPDAAID